MNHNLSQKTVMDNVSQNTLMCSLVGLNESDSWKIENPDHILSLSLSLSLSLCVCVCEMYLSRQLRESLSAVTIIWSQTHCNLVATHCNMVTVLKNHIILV